MRGPALVLPNHPGHIDPVLVMTHLGGEIPLRPLVVSFMYRPFYLNPLMRFIDALEVPDMVAHSPAPASRSSRSSTPWSAGLDRGGKFLIYPSGRVERNGLEQIGSTRAVPDILARRPGHDRRAGPHRRRLGQHDHLRADREGAEPAAKNS